MVIFSYNKITVASFQMLLNHASDKDLKDLLEDAINLSKQEETQIEALIKTNGIGLPPTRPERPIEKSEDIPELNVKKLILLPCSSQCIFWSCCL